ncbi:hypothetical protein [Streptomyces sp. NRRL S-1868]|uniref:hypothetical protein n=1 Tax=Streptomyces sp. NRRL S-1868 TaxID=1463892 RepID=UPI002D21A880|nr:hypothetical protein [Streptomyces sp. NRRL S-1868]
MYPPDEEGGRRVEARGQLLGVARNVMDVLDMLEAVGLERAAIRLDDGDLIEWRGGGSYEWDPDRG